MPFSWELNLNRMPRNYKTIKIYILPGGAGLNNYGWFDWLKKELQKIGYNNVTIISSNRVNPQRRAEVISKRYSLDENTVLVGHSFGALAAMKWSEQTKQKIYGLVLIDPSTKLGLRNYPPKNKREKDSNTKYLTSWGWQINMNVISKLVKRKIILSEDKLNEVIKDWRKSHKSYAKDLKAKFFHSQGKQIHFNGRQEPEVLKIVKLILN